MTDEYGLLLSHYMRESTTDVVSLKAPLLRSQHRKLRYRELQQYIQPTGVGIDVGCESSRQLLDRSQMHFVIIHKEALAAN